ncbi:MAG: glycosyltransferase family 2 protein [Candidatus Yanofskybacteria bacterium]|nr:glycosyltransferase family 2 protein [Candidatus Yanofskybacteria bacterium]
MPEFSIVIVHHQTPELLKLCLKSLKKTKDLEVQPRNHLEVEPLSKPEIIVVDSTISRQARDLIREQYPEIKYLPFKENLGYARGVNMGIKNSSGKFILILNPDVIVTDKSIQKMINFMEKHPDIGILGPQVLNFNGTHQRTFFSYYKLATMLARRSFLGRFGWFKRELDNFLMVDADPQKIQTPDWLMGSAIMVSREALNKIGTMDERFFMYFEDVDWARRFWHNDYKVVYYPEAVMYHYHQRESRSGLGLLDVIFNRKTRWHIASAIKFFWKYRNLQKIQSVK